MYSLRTGLNGTHTTSVKAMRSALSSGRSSVRELLQTNVIHQYYLSRGGREGAFGFPDTEVQFTGLTARRSYRGGNIEVLDDTTTKGLITQQAAVRFIGFRCIRKADHDQLSSTDEPYFVITVDQGDGRPVTRTLGPFENTDTGTEVGVGELLVSGVSPNPTAVRVSAYENDFGDPAKTAAALQQKLVEISNQVASVASASGAEAADGPGVGVGAAAAGAGGLLAGPLGALAAAGVVAVLGLGDDFIGENVTVAFARPEDTSTPPDQGTFQGNSFNAQITITGNAEGNYALFFDILVTQVSITTG